MNPRLSVFLASTLCLALIGCDSGGADAPPGIAPEGAKPLDPNATTTGTPIAPKAGIRASGPGTMPSGPATGTPSLAR